MNRVCDHTTGLSKVQETRRFEGQVFRVRECLNCRERFITVEVRAPKLPAGLQTDRKREKVPTWAALGIALRVGKQ